MGQCFVCFELVLLNVVVVEEGAFVFCQAACHLVADTDSSTLELKPHATTLFSLTSVLTLIVDFFFFLYLRSCCSLCTLSIYGTCLKYLLALQSPGQETGTTEMHSVELEKIFDVSSFVEKLVLGNLETFFVLLEHYI